MDSNNPFKIQRLKGSNNYDIWSIRTEAILADKGYSTTIDTNPYPEKATQKAIDTLNKEIDEKSPKAAAIIRLLLEDGPLVQVKGIEKAVDVWKRLKDLYEPKGFSSEFLLCRELFDTTLSKSGHSIEAYLTRIKRLTDDLATRGLGIPSKVIAAYALNNLSPEYENTVAIISQSFRTTTTTDIDIVQLFSQLIDESRRLKAKEPHETAMATDTKPKSDKNCTHCHRKGHSIAKCWKKHPELRPKGPRDDKGKSSETTLLTKDTSTEWALSTSEQIPTSTWLLDSGTTKHICANRGLFTELRPCGTILKWGKASTIKVNYSGDVRLQFKSTGLSTTLKDCLYAPEIGLNLLSLCQMKNTGISINIGPQYCELSQGGLLAKGLYKDNLIIFETESEYANIARPETIWHQRMGHIGNDALNALLDKTIGSKGPVRLSKDCETCIQAKTTAKISREPMTRASKVLEKVHSDICGPISPESFSKNRYFVSFIDDYSRYAEIRLLRSRDNLYDEFISWLNEEQLQLGAKLQRLHSDNAKEYKSGDFKSLFKSQGTKGTYSAPYSPQQNGISEKFNRTIFDKVRAMLIYSGLPKALWGEAAIAATYLYNRTPHSSLKNFMTPYEARYGKKPDISNIRIWGSITFKKEPKQLLKKLDPRANAYILVGYGENQYKLIKPGGRTTIWARDVDILEDAFIKDLPGQLAQKLARISEQVEEIKKEPLTIQESTIDIPEEDIPENRSTEEWLESFYKDLEQYSEDPSEEYSLISTDPTYSEAIKSPEAPEWQTAMKKEKDDLLQQNTWTLVPRTDNIKVLKGRWVLRIKEPLNEKPIYKARWVAKGFQQRLGVDFNETFANTVNPIAWRLLLAIGAYLDWEIKQWDVKSAYPNAPLQEKVYIQQPIGLEDPEKPNYICQLNKALYGLKQSGREWESFLRTLLSKWDLYPLKSDRSIYTNKDFTLILIVYVDDIIALSPENKTIDSLYNNLSKTINIKDLGNISTFLGIEISRDRVNKSISLHQTTYTEKILSKFGYKAKQDFKVISPIPLGSNIEPFQDKASEKSIKEYQRQIGSLIFLMDKTRPDLAFPVSFLARFMANPGPQHEKLLTKVWKSLEYTSQLGLKFQSGIASLKGYCDAD